MIVLSIRAAWINPREPPVPRCRVGLATGRIQAAGEVIPIRQCQCERSLKDLGDLQAIASKEQPGRQFLFDPDRSGADIPCAIAWLFRGTVQNLNLPELARPRCDGD